MFQFHFRYYKRGELKNFENIECEWPLFYIFMIIDGVFKSLPEQIVEYQELLKSKIHLDSNGGTYKFFYQYSRDSYYNCPSISFFVLNYPGILKATKTFEISNKGLILLSYQQHYKKIQSTVILSDFFLKQFVTLTSADIL